jgi:hypothetical protein
MMIGLLDFIGIARLSKGRGVAYVHSLIGCIEKERKERGGEGPSLTLPWKLGGGNQPWLERSKGRAHKIPTLVRVGTPARAT